ncbi:MAG: Cna B-type domain-containing protein [Acutalibacteraceae bacterium]|nr:Cna B-type domain-containing protein [Acutalibacteraceae bacterium]
MKKGCNFIASVLVILQIISLVCFSATALDVFDVNQECSLTLNYMYEKKPLTGADFDIYRVADISTDKTMTLVDNFKNSGVQLNGLDNEGFTKAAKLLKDSIGKTKPDYTLKTDSTGSAVADNLQVGVYLIIGKPIKMYNYTHYTMPQLVILPYENAVENSWDYAVTLNVKSVPVGTEEIPVDLTVVKKWNDKGYEEKRPTKITVHLLLNGEKYDTVTLSGKTDWQYKWTNLSPLGKWTVTEEVPANYVLEITQTKTGFELLNSRKDIEQTGQLWWPVPLLLLAGGAMIALGVILRRGKNDEA